MKKWLNDFREKHETLYQILSFYLLGGIAMVVDLGVFALCNYLIFRNYAGTPFHWWLLDYPIEEGGLCAFISFAISYVCSQFVNFLVQRKATFKATNNIWISGIEYFLMVLFTFVLSLWVPTVVSGKIYGLLGASTGAIVVKLLCQFVSAAIQFPLNKFVIMKS